MALRLVTPDANPSRIYSNGVKVFRLHEFLGPARGTLTTVADPWSLSGTVVRDSQQVAFTGTNPNKQITTTLSGVSGADTIRMTLSDLGMDTNFGYRMYVSARCEGMPDPSVASNGQDNFLQISGNSSIILHGRRDSGLTFFGTFGGTFYAPKQLTNPYYKIILLQGNPPFIETGFFDFGDIFVMRAGTGTGGSVVWFLDCLYMVPVEADTFTTPGNIYSDADFRRVMNNTQHEPLLDRFTNTYIMSRDDSPLVWTDGQFSVMPSAPDGFGIGNDSPEADFQDGEDEKTNYSVYGGFGTIDSAFDAVTDFAFVFGSQYTSSHEIDRDEFGRTVANALFPYLGTGQKNRNWQVVNNHPMQAAGAGAGFSIDGAKLCFNRAKYDQIFGVYDYPTPDPYASPGDYCSVTYGATALENGTGAVTTQGHETLIGMNSYIAEVMVTTDFILNAPFQMMFGVTPATAGNFFGIVLDKLTNGTFGTSPNTTLRMGMAYIWDLGGFPANDVWFGGPDLLTSTYSANTWVHLKFEVMWYRMRGKAWLDGYAEPDWLWDEKIPITGSVTPGLYPYTSDSTRGLSRRIRPALFPYLSNRYFAPIETNLGNRYLFHEGEGVRLTSTFWDNFVLTYDAYGDSPGDVHMRIGKSDDSVQYGAVDTSPESQRMVILDPKRGYTRDLDGSGLSITLWKDSGSPETQSVALTDGWQKIWRKSTFIPRIYRRTHG